MSIELDPAELGFERPFNHEVTRTLRIKNNNYDPVAFKVKTTAPKQYCVRPNSGRIEAGKDVEVQVLLQAMKEDPPQGYKCRDKFLVQSVAITADKEYNSVQQIWALVEKNEKSAIQEKKIRVTFLDPDEKANAPNGEIVQDILFNDTQSRSSPPPYTSPTPSDEPATSGTLPAPAIKSEPKSDGHSSTGDAIRGVANTQLQEQVKQHQQGLRERKTTVVASDSKSHTTESATGMGLTTHPPEGVSVQICAALCLVTFLLAYLFF
ncbi:uncharacterized protein LAJ45_11442 [Morchella importuna]|uniref:uncharacterized protein n=1 Tax=Morchella importuna TaxID=1174673 RepID=UPI001E8D26CA|nr:uncharacterized protein LAJ45_11442 [Morchella importuna]KAH8144545.1 hypothetical protein LAJ45_11442 [Morchella importuna]